MTIGGRYCARMEAKDGSFRFDFEAFYNEIIEKQQFTYEFACRKVNVIFNKLDNQTEVITTFDPEEENSIELQKGGWQAILNNFRIYTQSH